MSPELSTFLLGASPIGENRLAIPWGMTVGGLSAAETFFWAVLGNILAVVLITFLLTPVTNFARKNWPWLDRFFEKLFKKTRHKHSHRFNRWGALFLIFFVAIPLPGSGGHTGAMVAWLFGVPPKVAIPLVALGVILAGVIVLGITTGAITLVGLL